MSHHTDENKICPNCGFATTHNYCAQCGQETHLHKETFWGLVMHFIGHYFHYDSKFWMTMKALWFSPGKLTIAYRNQQRMRYIPPISLYIFISAVFFLCTYLGGSKGLIDRDHKQKTIRTTKTIDPSKGADSVTIDTTVLNTPGDIVHVNFHAPDSRAMTAEELAAASFFDRKADKIIAEHGNTTDYFLERLNHNIPKLFFFMIPAMAVLLKLLFARRKGLLFIDHAIFSLHYHCFWFSIFIISLLNFSAAAQPYILLVLLIIAAAYMAISMKRVYETGWVKAISYTLLLGIGYTTLLTIAGIIDLFVILIMA